MSLPTVSMRRSFAIQSRVIGALLMREILTRYGRDNIGFLWVFGEPMLFTLGITIVWNLMKLTHGSSLPITAFAITGYSPLLLWRNCSNRSVKSIEVNHSLLYHRNVRVFDVFTARVIVEIAGATASAIALTILYSAMGLMDPPADILTALMGWLLLAWFTYALSLVVGAASERSELVERTWHIGTYLALPFSGCFYMVDWLPKAYQKYVLWVPMVHGTEMLRHGYFGSAVRTYENPIYMILFNMVLFLIGLAMVKECGRRVEPDI